MGIAHDLIQIKIGFFPYSRWYLHEASAIFFHPMVHKKMLEKGGAGAWVFPSV